MKRITTTVLAAAALAAAALGTAAQAGATPLQDAQYVSCIADDGLASNSGPSSAAFVGRAIVTDIAAGLRSPAEEAAYVYANSNASITVTDANVMVNCATEVWLGYGPEGPHGSGRQQV